jgi:hypothetical protein
MRFRPGDDTSARPVITTLLDRYDAWYRAHHPGTEVVDVSDLDLLLNWKLNYADGRLDEWTVDQLEEFLLDWCPRKVSVSAADAALMPSSVAEAFTFLAHQRLLSPTSEPGARLAAHARSLASRFTREMANPAGFGLAKSLFAGLDVDLDEPITPDRLDTLMAEFNALPLEERTAILDQALEDEGEPDLPVIGPVYLPDNGAVRTSAAAAPVLAGFTALAEYFRAPGRPLTATGNIKLADAQALSSTLGTESLQEEIGGTTFTRHSAATMPRLDHWQWWAREVGALRVRNGRMVGVEAWLKRRAKDPVGEARKAFDVLAEYGPVASSVPRLLGTVNQLVDLMMAPLLSLMLSSPEPVEFATLVDAVEAGREATGQRGTFADPEHDRREAADAVERLLTLLERAGLITQHDPEYEPTRFHRQRVGGTVELTPFGVVVAVDQVRESGVEVVTLPDPAALTAAEVADLAAEQAVAADEWLEILVEWVDHQADRRAALRALLDAFPRTSMLLLAMALPMPEALTEDLAAVMEDLAAALPPDDALGAVATTWLLDHDRLDPDRLPREAVFVAGLTTLGLLAADDPESVPAAMGSDVPQRDHLDFVAEAARRMPPNIQALLDSIARHHPDKAVATAARKELLRMRSRLASERANAP